MRRGRSRKPCLPQRLVLTQPPRGLGMRGQPVDRSTRDAALGLSVVPADLVRMVPTRSCVGNPHLTLNSAQRGWVGKRQLSLQAFEGVVVEEEVFLWQEKARRLKGRVSPSRCRPFVTLPRARAFCSPLVTVVV